MTKQKWLIIIGILIGLISVITSIAGKLSIIYSILFIFIIAGSLYYINIENMRQTASKSIVEALERQKADLIGTLKDREPRIYPGKPLPSLVVYDEVITSIKLHGYMDLLVQNMGLEIDRKKVLSIHEVTPGMSKRFMVLIHPETSSLSNKKLKYLRVYSQDMTRTITNFIDDRDYVETIFIYILPVLGNFSEKISEKTFSYSSNEFDASQECYFISKYKYFGKEKKGLSKLRIYIS